MDVALSLLARINALFVCFTACLDIANIFPNMHLVLLRVFAGKTVSKNLWKPGLNQRHRALREVTVPSNDAESDLCCHLVGQCRGEMWQCRKEQGRMAQERWKSQKGRRKFRVHQCETHVPEEWIQPLAV